MKRAARELSASPIACRARFAAAESELFTIVCVRDRLLQDFRQ